MSIKEVNVKKLYGKAAGRCSICREKLYRNDVIIGQMAHVIAKSKNGPRGEVYFHGDINDYENLILLCANHHIEVDGNPAYYPVHKLHQIKNDHELWIDNRLNIDERNLEDVNSLKAIMEYSPFTYLGGFANGLPENFDIRLFDFGTVFDGFLLGNPDKYPFNDLCLARVFEEFFSSYEDLCSVLTATYNNSLIFSDVSRTIGTNYTSYLNIGLLPRQTQTMIRDTIELNLNNFQVSYHNLISYLRREYQDVRLNSYRAIQF